MCLVAASGRSGTSLELLEDEDAELELVEAELELLDDGSTGCGLAVVDELEDPPSPSPPQADSASTVAARTAAGRRRTTRTLFLPRASERGRIDDQGY